MGDEVLVWSKVWPHRRETWLGSPCLSCPRTLGFDKRSSALVASTWHSLVSKRKWLSFSQEHSPPRPPNTPCGWELFHRVSGLWQSWVSKLAPGVGPECHKVTSGEWQTFPSGTKDLLVLGGQNVLSMEKKTEEKLVHRLERLFHEMALLGKILALSCCQNGGGWITCRRDASLLQRASLVSQKWLNSLILLSKCLTKKENPMRYNWLQKGKDGDAV